MSQRISFSRNSDLSSVELNLLADLSRLIVTVAAYNISVGGVKPEVAPSKNVTTARGRGPPVDHKSAAGGAVAPAQAAGTRPLAREITIN